MQPAQYQIPESPPSSILQIREFGGINLSTIAAEIADNEASDMRNFMIDVRGALDKRKGYKKVIQSEEKKFINGMAIYKKHSDEEEFIFACNTKLYKLDTLKGECKLIYNGLKDNDISFFNIEDLLYILDGEHYKIYDGKEVKEVEGYVPTIYTECVPSGSGNSFEQLNLISRAYKQNFSADGEAKEYNLAIYPLGSEKVEGHYFDEKGKHELVEGTDFTVDREKGKLTLKKEILKGTGNVNFKAYMKKDNSSEIKNCKVAELYGGNNDTRVFLWGNFKYPNRVYYSGLTTTGLNPTYFPANNLINIGESNEAVIGMVKQYDSEVIVKESSLHLMRYTTDNKGLGMFPVRTLNSKVGCLAPYSIQLIQNSPVFLNKNGVYVVNQSNVRDERNVTLISEKVNKALLQENLKAATSIDYENKYLLSFPSGNVYVYDYILKVWYIWTNIKATCFLEYENYLFFGNDNGTIYRFSKNERNNYMDNGKSIDAYWKSKLFNFGTDNMRKMVEKIFFSMKPDSRTSLDLYYYTEDGQINYIDTAIMDLFDYTTFDYSRFTYLYSNFPLETMQKIKAKKIVYFQIVVENSYENDSLGILSIDIKYRLQSYVK